MRIAYELTLDEIFQAIGSDDYLGLCQACGSVAEQVEPDATNYTCRACGRFEVFGLEELLMMGEFEDEKGANE